MTGFASQQGQGEGCSWSWDLRGVNGKGLDVRLRVPDWIEGLEPALKELMGKRIGRGNVTLSLRLTRDETATPMQIDEGFLDQTMQALSKIELLAKTQGIGLRESSAAEILSQKGILIPETDDQDIAKLKAMLMTDVQGLVLSFVEMRQAEGAALKKILTQQLNEISILVGQAQKLDTARRDKTAQMLRDALTRITENSDNLDEGRIAQELAIVGIKADVTEELDRLVAHVGAAEKLLAQSTPVGRKLDFLMQEFNREANTLCSKSQFTELTRIGLDLKATIDQMREQVQNVE